MGKYSDALEKGVPVYASGNQGNKEKEGGGVLQPSIAPSEQKKNISPTAVIPTRHHWDERLLLATEPDSSVIESFRRLRGTILHAHPAKRPRTILITSLVPNEGKGFVCANLGVALAEEMEHHALMVDCDFRRPNLAKLFGVSNQTGLVDYLQDNVELSLLIRQTGQHKLSLIPSGRTPHNPAELLTSTKITSFIDELTERYEDRIILFDSAPTVVASETSILAKRVDGVILVVRWGASSKELVKKFAETLGPEKIIGVVFNAYKESTVESVLYKNSSYDYHYNYK
ncbi:MAG: CpsD/CapB family tyrosine-protein kinase [Proteobacteria bacterium]|nr:CpsD/CapB family tyrosine-protein kinase [Pseudomonadota bacterium]MBU1640672.1 CpsD/CapB family tyrosine-protein kinase [Pseudomonadota bacterium]